MPVLTKAQAVDRLTRDRDDAETAAKEARKSQKAFRESVDWAIRNDHLTPREVAVALGISTQRVYQIVEETRRLRDGRPAASHAERSR